MAAVFPEQMNKLDMNDTAGSLRTIESYIRYMTERMEFSNRNTARSVNEAGVSSVEVYQKLLDVVNAMSVLQSSLNGLSGEVNSMNNRITELGGTITSIQSNISTLQSDVSGAKNNISTIQGNITSIQGDLSGLTARVTTLENAGTGG